MEDLEEAISLHRSALQLRSEDHPLRPESLGNLATSLSLRFEFCGKLEDLEESITLERSSLELRPNGHPKRSLTLGNLAGSLWLRFQNSEEWLISRKPLSWRARL